jgi:hypothetical protein
MNVLLWILQGGLALLLLAGGAYKLLAGADVAKQVPSVPRAAWGVFGAIEVVAGILLIVPAAFGWMPELTPLAAVVVAVESLVLSVAYARTSVAMRASNPLVYAATIGIVAAFVAYGRYVISPLA